MYDQLTEDVFGVYGRIVARAEAQCLRFSILYAALDGSKTIEVHHLGAAWELWRYFDTSAWRIFGANDVTGDPVTDRLVAELRRVAPAGLDGTQQSALFSRHVSTDRLTAARSRLADLHLAETIKEETGGRPRLVTFACEQSDLGEQSPDGTPFLRLTRLFRSATARTTAPTRATITRTGHEESPRPPCPRVCP
jgi:hypothetical protein